MSQILTAVDLVRKCDSKGVSGMGCLGCASCVTLGKVLDLPEPVFSILERLVRLRCSSL